MFHKEENLFENGLEINWDGCARLAVEAQHSSADLCDSREFAFRHVDELLGLLFGDSVAHEIEEIGDGVQRVVNFVSNGGGKAARDGELFVCKKSFLSPALDGDITKDEHYSDDCACLLIDDVKDFFEKTAGSV